MSPRHFIAVLSLCLQVVLAASCLGGGQDLVKQLDGLVTMVESKAGSSSEAQIQQYVGRYNGLVSSINRQYTELSPVQLEKAKNLCARFKRVIGKKSPDAVLIVLKPSDVSPACMEKEVAGQPGTSSFDGLERRETDDVKVTHSPGRSELGGDEIFDKYGSAVFVVILSDGTTQMQGSGFFISPDGLAVSNYHVFRGCKRGSESICLADGSVCEVKDVIAKGHSDGEGLSTDDFILFKVDVGDKRMDYIPVGKDLARVGQRVYAIGSPRGFENTFSSGEVSQIRSLDGGFLYQISVPIDHGSSGGVLLNAYGEAIGITSGGFDDSGANLNFAVDIHVIDNYINN